MDRIAVLAARRTPIGIFGGVFRDVSAVDLGVAALRATLADAGVGADRLDEVITGNVLSANLGQNVNIVV